MLKKFARSALTCAFGVVLLLSLFCVTSMEAKAAGEATVNGLTVTADGECVVTPDENSITISLSGTKGGFLGSGAERKTAEVKIANTSAATEAGQVSFSVSFNEGGAISSNAGSLTGLNNGDSPVLKSDDPQIVCTLTSAKGSSPTSVLTLSNISFQPDTVTSTVNFIAPGDKGTVAVNGTPITATSEITQSANDPFVLSATPAAGYNFICWYYGDAEQPSSSTLISESATYNHTGSPDTVQTISAWFVPGSADENPFQVNSATFPTWEDALAYAGIVGANQINLVNNHTLTESITIPAGVSFVLPYSLSEPDVHGLDGKLDYANARGVLNASGAVENNGTLYLPGGGKEPTVRLTVPSGMSITVENNAKLVVGGIMGSSSGGYSGQTCDSFSQIDLGVGSTINVKGGGILSCCGYITGGSVVAESGATVYEPFVICDFNGGTYTAVSYKTRKIAPFNRYAMFNIQSTLALRSGAALKGYAMLTVKNLMQKVEHNHTVVNVFGENGSLLNINGAELVMTYDPTSVVNNGSSLSIGRTTIRITDGTVTYNAMEMELASVSVSMSDVDFPVPYNLVFDCYNTVVTIPNKIKLLPGTEIYIRNGARMDVTGELGIYDGFADLRYSAPAYPSAAVLQAAGVPARARLVVDGTLNVTGTLAGLVESTGDTGTITVGSGAKLTRLYWDGVAVEDHYNYMYKIDPTYYQTTYTERTLNARVWMGTREVNGESVKELVAMETGKTYYAYNNGTDVYSATEFKYTGANDLKKNLTDNTVEKVGLYGGTEADPLAVETDGAWMTDVALYCRYEYESGQYDTVFVGNYAPGTSITVSAPADSAFEHLAKGYTLNWPAMPTSLPRQPEYTVTATGVTAIQYTITYDLKGGSVGGSNPTAYTVESDAFTLINPERTGYTFDGWTGTGLEKATDTVTIPTGSTGARSYTANWTAKTYTVNLDYDGYEAEGLTESITVTFGSTFADLPTPTREGYTFEGWYTEGNVEVKSTDAVPESIAATEGMTLTAKWEIKTYAVTWNANGGAWPSATTLTSTHKYNDALTYRPIDEPTREGYTFDGWSQVPATMPDVEDLVIEAQWKAIEYTITFDTAGGTSVADITADYETDITAPAAPTKTGYTFTGWVDTATNTKLESFPTAMPLNGLTLKATWEINKYTITFADTGDVAYPAITQDYDTDVAAVRDPAKTGYTFTGWINAAGHAATVPAKMPAGDLELTATWQIKEYTVTFDTDGGSTIDPITQDYNTVVKAPADPVKTGYTFKGWDKAIPATMPAENVTVTATWEINRYTITFDTDGGSAVAAITQDYDTEVAAPAAPTREGYTFQGWEPAVPAKMPAADKTLTAQWEAISYPITYDLAGGTATGSNPTAYTIASDAITLSNPTRTGYTFAGWTGTGLENAADPVTIPTGSTGARSYTATWTAKTYTVNLNYGYEAEGVTGSITVTYGGTYGALPTPEREGHGFEGWYTAAEDGEKVLGSTIVPADITEGTTLYARWTVGSFTISYKDSDGTLLDSKTYPYGAEIAGYTPTKTGYKFAGWTPALPETMGAENLTVTATWSVERYTVTWDAGDGTWGEGAETTSTFEFGAPITAPVGQPTREGYTFHGWGEVPEKMPAEDLSVTAQWKANEYTITFNTDGGSAVAAITQDYNTAVTAPENPTKTGYTFAGWVDEEGHGVTVPEKMPLNGATLKAVWSINSYTVTWDANGGTWGEDAEITSTVPFNETIAEPAEQPTRTGYTFAGWSQVPATMPAEDLRVTAQWTAKTYSVTLKHNYEGAPAEDSLSVTFGSTFAGLPTPTREGHTFDGWFTGAEDGEEVKDGSHVPERIAAGEGMTLYAHWTINAYTVTWDANDGTWAEGYSNTATVKFGDPITAPTEQPTREGYTFDGWEGLTDGATMGAADVTCKAIWTANEHTVTWMNGETEHYKGTVAYGNAIATPADPTKDGYTFKGWMPAIPETMPNNALTFAATWEANTYTITFDEAGGNTVTDIKAPYEALIATPADHPPTRTGYTFAGWVDGEGEACEIPATMPLGGKKLTAVWEPAQYTVVWNANGGAWADGETSRQTACTYEANIAAPDEDPTREHYDFSGWNGFTPGSTVMGAADRAFSAVWTAKTYYVTFDANTADAVGGMTGQPIVYQTSVALTACAFTRSGYNFTGWNTSADGSGTAYSDGAAVELSGDVTLYAQWARKQTTISFDKDSTGLTETVNSTYADTVTLKDISNSRPGYRFDGWYYLSGTEKIPFEKIDGAYRMPAEDITLYAEWTGYLELLTGITQEQLEQPEQLALARDYYGKLALNANLLREYQTAHSAHYEKIQSVIIAAVKQSVESGAPDAEEILISESGQQIATLAVDAVKNKVDICVESRDTLAKELLGIPFFPELLSSADISMIRFNDLADFPTYMECAPNNQMELMLRVAFVALRDEAGTDDVEKFNSWLMDQVDSCTVGEMDGETVSITILVNTKEGFTGQIDYELTFYNRVHDAIWTVDGEQNKVAYRLGETVYKPADDPAKAGYKFLYWVGADGAQATFPATMAKSDLIYTAVFEPLTYTVALDYSGYENESLAKSIAVTYDGTFAALPNPVRTGYAFGGWFTGENGTGTRVENANDVAAAVDGGTVADGATLYAMWNADRFNISYYDSDGVTVLKSESLDCDAEIPAYEPAAEAGYKFTGWVDAHGEPAAVPATMPAEHLELYARWEPLEYTITFDTDGGSPVESITAPYKSAVTAPADPTKEGYTFNGWDQKFPETMPLDGLTLTAVWKANIYRITFDSNGGSAVEDISAAYGATVPVRDEPVREGHKFTGWADADGNKTAIPAEMPLNGLALTATWSKNSYTVTWVPNGGVWAQEFEAVVSYAYGDPIQVPTVELTMDGHTFAGWKDFAEGTMPAKDLTFTAQWAANVHTVIWMVDGAQYHKDTVAFGQSIPVPADPDKQGYVFGSWTPAVPGTMPDEDLTFTALWNTAGDTPYTVEYYQEKVDGSGYEAMTGDTFHGTGETGTTATAKQAAYEGFHLNEGESTLTGAIAADGSLVLKLYYDRNRYEIKWVTHEGQESVTCLHGAELSVPAQVPGYGDDRGTYTFQKWEPTPAQTVTGSAVYTAQYTGSSAAIILGSGATYRTLEMALAAAESGDVVRLESDVTLDKNLVVPAGVTLVIPCVDGDTGYQRKSYDNGILFNHDGTAGAGNGPSGSRYRTLTIPQGKTLTVKGTVLVNSVSGRLSTAESDQDITGGYGQIMLDGDIQVAAGGVLECFGYIKGSGAVTAQPGGTVGDLFLVRNWRGGSQASNVVNEGWPAFRAYPMNESDCHNIECKVKILSGGTYTGLVKMYASNSYHYTRFPQIDNTNGLIRLTGSDSYVERFYEDSRERFEIHGGAVFANSSLTIVGLKLSTGMFIYPIDGDIDFVLYEGNYTFCNSFKFMTGATMVAKEGAHIVVEESAVVDGKTEKISVVFYDVFKDKDNVGNTEYPDRPEATLTLEQGASLTNNGSFAGVVIQAEPSIYGGANAKWEVWSAEADGHYATSTQVLKTIRLKFGLTKRWLNPDQLILSAVTAGSGKNVTADVSVTNTYAQAKTCTVWVAAYSAAGRMLDSRYYADWQVAAGETGTKAVTLSANQDIAYIRLFALDSSYAPMCELRNVPVK